MNLNKEDIKFLVDNGVPVVTEKNYWFIRTKSGMYFEDFYFSNYVGIEWNEISNIDYINENDADIIEGTVKKYYPSQKRPGYISKQIKRFVSEINIGDIVLIPNENSEKIAFGEIISDTYVEYEPKQENFFDALIEDSQECNKKKHFIKRRKVKWIKVINRSMLDPYLYRIIYSHSTIVRAKPYEIFINRALYPFYIKNDMGYINFRVNKTEDIPGTDLFDFVGSNIDLLKCILKDNDLPFNKQKLQTKINVQCPGDIQFIGYLGWIFIIAFASTALLGGHVKFLGLDFKCEGLSSNLRLWAEMVHKWKSEDNKNIINRLQESGNALDISTTNVSNNGVIESDTSDNNTSDNNTSDNNTSDNNTSDN